MILTRRLIKFNTLWTGPGPSTDLWREAEDVELFPTLNPQFGYNANVVGGGTGFLGAPVWSQIITKACTSAQLWLSRLGGF